MYLAMARQADREGYPEIAEAYKRYAYEEADHASRFAELLGEVWVIPRAISRLVLQQRRVLVRISSALPSLLRSRVQMLSTIPFMRWLRMKPATVQVCRSLQEILQVIDFKRRNFKIIILFSIVSQETGKPILV